LKQIIFLVLIAGSILSCQKKNETTADPAKVTINITSPAKGQVYHNGDSVSINADITYTTELHGYEVKIIDTSTGFVVYDQTEHVHDDHFSIRYTWADSVTKQTGLKLSIITAIDHDGNTAGKDVYFQYQP